ncbi:MAG: hypothetical protein IT370_00895 [Deltaproteobacteria bacterium]|nr:hypothetical protein [Deltaproteobacteria bacterium]
MLDAVRRHALTFAFAALALLPAACKKSPRQEPTPSRTPAPTAPPQPARLPTADEGFVGLLIENAPGDDFHPADYCLDDGQQWRGLPARLGRINVAGVTPSAALYGHHVIVWGRREASLDAVISKLGPCPPDDRPMAQMRSDWIADEGGYLTTHARLAATPVLRALRIEPLTLAGFGALPDGGVGHGFSLHNPFDAALSGSLRAHWEGGRGKPMPHYVDQPFVVAPGATLTVALPFEPGDVPDLDRAWRLHAVHVVGSAGRVTVNADVFVESR